MKNYILSGLVCLAVLSSCNNNEDVTTVTTDTTLNNTAGNTDVNTTTSMPLNMEDSSFVMEAASGGLMEVQGGQLAQQMGRNAAVKEFGAMMVRDHQAANNELKSIAGMRNLILGDTMMKKHRDHVEMLKKASGANFDKQYIDMMVTAHNEDIAKFERAAGTATDDQLKAFATKTLPILKMHRDSAQAIKSRL